MVAIDGKALRRALDDGASIPDIVSAWASEHGLVLGQVKVADYVFALQGNHPTVHQEITDFFTKRVYALRGVITTYVLVFIHMWLADMGVKPRFLIHDRGL